MNANVIIQDKTHDPFIIFGGLFARSEITKCLNNIHHLQDFSKEFSVFEEYKRGITNQNISEERLRQSIAKFLLRGVTVDLPRNSQKDIVYKNCVIEVKKDLKEFDLDLLKGSVVNKKFNRQETAIEELFRYLDTDEYEWGVLTTGRIFRFYHKSSQDQYIEFDLFDIIASGDIDHFNLLKHFLVNHKLKDEIFAKTGEIRNSQAKEQIRDQLSCFLTESERQNRQKCTDKIITFLTLVGIRYLEDIGCLPVLSTDYQAYRVGGLKKFDKKKILKIIDKFQDGTWFNGNRQLLLTDDEYGSIKNVLSSDVNLRKLTRWMADYDKFDYSDIVIDQLGGVYQEIVNKNSEGAYYTPYVIGKKISSYLKNLSEIKKIGFEKDEEKVIVDVACGSGQLLRALVPSANLFFKSKGSYLGKNSLRRLFIKRLVGVDKDPNSVFICKLSLGLFAAEQGRGLSLPKLTKEEDTLEAFCNSRSNFAEINRANIFSIVTNPPWESLEFNETNFYRKVTGLSLPKKSSINGNAENTRKMREFEIWSRNNKSLIKEEERRIEEIRSLYDKVSIEHKDYFTGKKNTALVFMFVIHQIIEHSNGSYVVILPDRFFIGDTTPLRDKIIHEFDAYIPFQNCGSIFDGVDKGTRFGILFGRKKNRNMNSNINLQIPVIEELLPVDFIKQKISKRDLMFNENGVKKTILPFFRTSFEVDLLNKWMVSRHRIDSWRQGKINLGARDKSDILRNNLSPTGRYKIVKSVKKITSKEVQFKGVLETPLGIGLKKLPDSLQEHYNAEKIIAPNVKRNGVRKILVSLEKNCIVEHAYNYNKELETIDLYWLRSMVFNAIVNTLSGAYNINTTMLNLLGQIRYTHSANYYENEINLLVSLGVPRFSAVESFLRFILSEYPEEIKKQGLVEIKNSFAEVVRNIDFSYDSIYSELISHKTLFDVKPHSFNIEKSAEVSSFIINKLKSDKNFGRVKFAKVLYLSQHLCKEDLGIDWQRKVAGPYNKSDILKIETRVKQDSDIDVVSTKVNGKIFYKYKKRTSKRIPEPNIGKRKINILKRLIDLFKGLDSDKMELIATIFAVWNDLLIQGKMATEQEISDEFLNNWHPNKKKKFSKDKIFNELSWMKKNKIIPTGYGYTTD